MKIRVCELSIKNLKNIANGTIIFPNGKHARTKYPDGAEIIGIYGQNGSGKSTVVEALALLKQILSGEQLPADTYELITENEIQAKLVCKFYFKNGDQEVYLSYEIILQKEENHTVQIISEKLKTSYKNNGVWSKITPSLWYDIQKGYSPSKYFTIKKEDDLEAFLEMKILAKKLNKSYIINNYMVGLLQVSDESAGLSTLIDCISWYAHTNLIVIKNDFTGDINNRSNMPFIAHMNTENNMVIHGDVKIPMNGVSFIKENLFQSVTGILEQINIVLSNIIPTMKIGLKNHGSQLMDDGEEGLRIELLSSHNGHEIPFRMESDGIKKITSVLSALIAMYNKDSVFLAIDELDAGVYEYLLGEMIQVLQENGKGQLLFTSHNLILLERLSKDCIYFTTTDPMDRFMQFQYVKKNNNLRDLYLRTIELGGQDKEIYQSTSSARMNHAFRKAGNYIYVKNKD